jgi:hypothetical protein
MKFFLNSSIVTWTTFFFLVLSFSLLFSSCNSNDKKSSNFSKNNIEKDSLTKINKILIEIDKKIQASLDKINESRFLADKTWNGSYFNTSGWYYPFYETSEADNKKLVFLAHLTVDGEGWPMETYGYYFNPLNGSPIAKFHINTDGATNFTEIYNQLDNDSGYKFDTPSLVKNVWIIDNQSDVLRTINEILTDFSQALIKVSNGSYEDQSTNNSFEEIVSSSIGKSESYIKQYLGNSFLEMKLRDFLIERDINMYLDNRCLNQTVKIYFGENIGNFERDVVVVYNPIGKIKSVFLDNEDLYSELLCSD